MVCPPRVTHLMLVALAWHHAPGFFPSLFPDKPPSSTAYSLRPQHDNPPTFPTLLCPDIWRFFATTELPGDLPSIRPSQAIARHPAKTTGQSNS